MFFVKLPSTITTDAASNGTTRSMIETEGQSEFIVHERRDPAGGSDVSLLDILVLLLRRKRFIGVFVITAMLLATAIAFLLPVRYEAKTLLLPPTQNSSISSALAGPLGNLGNMGSLGSLASLAGGGLSVKNPADMYIAFLTGRTVEDAMVQRFSLMNEYHERLLSDARKDFEHRTSVTAGNKDGLIHIAIEDADPKRAADLANGYVDEFRKLSATLAITEAGRRRLFFEQQLQQSKDKLTEAEDAMRKTEQSTGVLQIDSQARSLIESAAVLRAQVVAKQVQIQGMKSFATEDNPSLILARQELGALQSQLAQVAGSQTDVGSDINLSKGRVTQSGMEYLRSYRELKYQETIFELLAKEFEIAKLDEAREGSIVQVVDAAVPPDRRSSPHRLLIVLGAAIVAFFLAIVWVWLQSKLSVAFDLPENRHRLRLIKSLWSGKARAA
jgi:tyrosine-protein kinase Etk/Wzc